MIQIITDSASDITQKEAEKLGIWVLPMTIQIGGQEYRDGVDIMPQEFYQKLVEQDNLPMTSQIAPYMFEEAIKKAVDAGNQVLILTISGELSGTAQSARIAADNYANVRIVDTENVSVGEQCLVYRALQLIKNEVPLEELAEILEQERKQVRVLALLDTLEYLKKGGRISRTVAFAGGVLSIKPVVTVEDGKVQLVGKARGSRNANNLLRELIEKSGGIDFEKPVFVGYTGLDDAMLRKYLEDSASIWEHSIEKVPEIAIGSAIGTHVGPGAIAVAFFA